MKRKEEATEKFGLSSYYHVQHVTELTINVPRRSSHVNCTSRQTRFRARRPLELLGHPVGSPRHHDPFVANPTTAIRKFVTLLLRHGNEDGERARVDGRPTRGAPAPSFPMPFSVSRVFVLRNTRHEDVHTGKSDL